MICTRNRQGQRSTPTSSASPQPRVSGESRTAPAHCGGVGCGADVPWVSLSQARARTACRTSTRCSPAPDTTSALLFPSINPRQFPSWKQLPHTQPCQQLAQCSVLLAPNAVPDFSSELFQLCSPSNLKRMLFAEMPSFSLAPSPHSRATPGAGHMGCREAEHDLSELHGT